MSISFKKEIEGKRLAEEKRKKKELEEERKKKADIDHHQPTLHQTAPSANPKLDNKPMFCWLWTPIIGLLLILMLVGGALLLISNGGPDESSITTTADDGIMADQRVLTNEAESDVIGKDLRQGVVKADHQQQKVVEQLSPTHIMDPLTTSAAAADCAMANDGPIVEVLVEKEVGRGSTQQTNDTPVDGLARVRRDEEPTESTEGGSCDASWWCLMQFLVGFGLSMVAGMLIAGIYTHQSWLELIVSKIPNILGGR